MGEFTDKATAAKDKIAGMSKEAAGKLTGDEKLEAEGEAQQLKAKGEKVKGEVKGAMGDKF